MEGSSHLTAGGCSPSKKFFLTSRIQNAGCVFLTFESHISDGRDKLLWASHCLATKPVLNSLLAGFNSEEEEALTASLKNWTQWIVMLIMMKEQEEGRFKTGIPLSHA